jgi:hypothetical protein
VYNANLVLDIQDLPAVFRAFNTWDTQHYMLLSQRGYGVNPMSNAFYPLYPYLIWIFTPLFFNKGLIAAYVIANLFSLLVPVYMYKLCCLFWTKEQAFRSTVLLLAFPTAFFMSVAFTESLYLSLCLMAFYYLFTEDVRKACVLCFLLPLVRAQSLLFVVPIGVMFMQVALTGALVPARGGAKRPLRSSRANRIHAARTLLPPAFATLMGMAAYFVFCQWQLGGFLEGMKAQQVNISKYSLANVLMVHRWFMTNFVDITLQLHSYKSSMIDRAAFILCAPILIGVYPLAQGTVCLRRAYPPDTRFVRQLHVVHPLSASRLSVVHLPRHALQTT